MNVDTMLKDPQTPRYAQRRTHRTYTPQFKADLVAMCQKPGASIAAVALQHGMNANLLHRWRKEWAQGLHRLEGGVTATVATPQTPAFIPIELSTAASTTASEQLCVASSTRAADIRIECQRPGMSVTVHWPLSGAAECAQMLRELLR
jgi:transposase